MCVAEVGWNATVCIVVATCEFTVQGRMCGVQAVGRCSEDGKAFCASHRAVTHEGTVIIDRCRQCYARSVQEYWDAAAAEKAEKAQLAQLALTADPVAVAARLAQLQRRTVTLIVYETVPKRWGSGRKWVKATRAAWVSTATHSVESSSDRNPDGGHKRVGVTTDGEWVGGIEPGTAPGRSTGHGSLLDLRSLREWELVNIARWIESLD